MIVLGIETSCDETAAAVVTGERKILSNRILSQIDHHQPFGGVVPEIAARAHLEYLDGLIAEAMNEAGMDFGELDGVAATGGPGLIGGVIVGVMTAKAIAAVHNLPFLAINHLEAHALTARLNGLRRVPLPVTVGFRRPLPALGGRERRPIHAAWHYRRRRLGRSVR